MDRTCHKLVHKALVLTDLSVKNPVTGCLVIVANRCLYLIILHSCCKGTYVSEVHVVDLPGGLGVYMYQQAFELLSCT